MIRPQLTFPILSLHIPSSPSKPLAPAQSLLPNLCISKLFSGSNSNAFLKHFDFLSDFSLLFLSSVSLVKKHFQLFESVSCLSLRVSPLKICLCFSYSIEFLLTINTHYSRYYFSVTKEGGKSLHNPTATLIPVPATSLHL